ncbi:MAG: hypothetical protein ACRENN_09565 [Candidatus Eiseniibacteriota bacterium]
MKRFTVLSRISSSTRLRLSMLALCLIAAALAAAPAAAAPIGFEAFGGVQTNGNNDFLLGAGLRLSLASITVIPNVEYYFVDNGSVYALNADATMSVLPLGVASGFVGAGLGMITYDPDFGDSNTNTAVNLLAGVGLNAVPMKPFAQFKYVFTDGDDPILLEAGIRF